MYNFIPNSPSKLETQTMTTISSPPPIQPPSVVTVVKPVSYQFQVVEYTKDDKIMKVELQMQATTHDEFGNVVISSGFTAVPRVQLPMVEYK